MKKFCAVFGIFRNEKYFLPIWLRYYSNLFGMENLYVIDDKTTDGSVKNLQCNYEILEDESNKNIQRLGAHDYPRIWEVIKSKYMELLQEYDYVINVDADEIIVANPEKYKNLVNFIEQMGDYTRCTGYEVVHRRNKELDLDWSRSILEQRKYWIRQTNVDKPAITRKMLDWIIGKHFLRNKKNEPTNKDLVLFHLHRVDYRMYKEKYFISDETIEKITGGIPKSKVSNMESLVGGYPNFWNLDDLNRNFDDVNCNVNRGALPAKLEKIPDIYKGVF